MRTNVKQLMQNKRRLIMLLPTGGKTTKQMSQEIHKELKKKMPKIYLGNWIKK